VTYDIQNSQFLYVIGILCNETCMCTLISHKICFCRILKLRIADLFHFKEVLHGISDASHCCDGCRDEDDGEFLQTKEILDELGVNHVSIGDCRSVRNICKAVSERAAYLASTGVFIATTYT